MLALIDTGGTSRLIAILRSLIAVVLLTLNATPSMAQDTDSASLLASAWRFESNSDYSAAARMYREYLLSKPVKSAASRHARLKLPVLQEAAHYGPSAELDLYLSALNSRANGDTDSALSLIQRIINNYQLSHYYDDALYLKAYIEMMDNYDFQRAHNTLQSLRYAHPASRYYDTALYSEAIAQEQLGNRSLAISKLQELRERHTSLSLGGLQMPKDSFIARLWFDRSNDRLKYLQQHQRQASSLVSMRPYGQHGFQWRAIISVDGKDMPLLLNQSLVTKHTRIVSGEGIDIDTTDTNAFAGRVEGEPDSWARITLAENNLRGMVSVYGERYRLMPTQTGGTLSEFNPLLLGDIDGNIPEHPDHALYPPKAENEIDEYLRGIRVIDGLNFEEGTVGLTATLGVVIDSKFNSYHGGRGAEEAKSILNTVDGIFREQFGLALHIDTIIVIASDDDPMNLGSVPMETMMRNFSAYRQSSPQLGSDISMATLFSGNKNSDSALGLAWIGSACRTDGYDVSVVSPYRLADLLSTHEIGHTLGADHDSDTTCSANSGHIMWPYLSGSTQREFSSCSKTSVHRKMAEGNCFIDTLDISVGLVVSDTYADVSVVNQDATRVSNGATLTLNSEVLSSLASTPAQCKFNNLNLTCQIGSIAPGGSANIALEFTRPLTDAEKITVVAKPVGFMDSEPDNNSIGGDAHGNLYSVAGSAINSVAGSPAPGLAGDAAAGALRLPDLLTLLALLSAGAWRRVNFRV